MGVGLGLGFGALILKVTWIAAKHIWRVGGIAFPIVYYYYLMPQDQDEEYYAKLLKSILITATVVYVLLFLFVRCIHTLNILRGIICFGFGICDAIPFMMIVGSVFYAVVSKESILYSPLLMVMGIQITPLLCILGVIAVVFAIADFAMMADKYGILTE